MCLVYSKCLDTGAKSHRHPLLGVRRRAAFSIWGRSRTFEMGCGASVDGGGSPGKKGVSPRAGAAK
eukprot:COSAG06_NODE_65553_length_256_cov_1.649682_1_plen_65_part_10